LLQRGPPHSRGHVEQVCALASKVVGYRRPQGFPRPDPPIVHCAVGASPRDDAPPSAQCQLRQRKAPQDLVPIVDEAGRGWGFRKRHALDDGPGAMPRSSNPICLGDAGATTAGQLRTPNLPQVDISALVRAADHGPVEQIVWITGASSGIGAALAATAPADARVIGIARRPSACAESIQADLSDPAEWPRVTALIRETLARERPAEAVLMHFAGVAGPVGDAATIDPTGYAWAAILNAVSGQVLGAAFLRSAGELGSRASIVMCSSPAATHPRSGLSQYCAGKAALEQWVRTVAVEEANRDNGAYVFAVVPYAVDTAMVRKLIEAEDAVPLAAHFRQAAGENRLAAPDRTARQIWQLLEAGDRHGEVAAVGAVPAPSQAL
jgi:benzil reductase ((S)-benzoin forming)